MSRPFNNNMPGVTFAQVNEPLCASDHIRNKRSKYTFCSPNVCAPNKNIYSQSNLLTLRRANRLAFYPCLDEFDKNQLYSNLYTKLDLTGTNIPVITKFDITGNKTPAQIDPNNLTPYLSYDIDVSGNLFGNSRCGINNYLNYVVYNPNLKGK